MSTEDADDDRDQRPVSVPVVVAAIAVPLVLLVAALVWARGVTDRSRDDQASSPLAVVPVEAPDATSPECTALVAALPHTLGDASRVDFSGPAPAGTAAYRMPSSEPVVVRCGLPAPTGFRADSALQQVDSVQWFQDRDPTGQVEASTWIAVDRPRTVVVTLPDGSGTGPIQDLSAAVARALPAVAPRPAPVR